MVDMEVIELCDDDEEVSIQTIWNDIEKIDNKKEANHERNLQQKSTKKRLMPCSSNEDLWPEEKIASKKWSCYDSYSTTTNFEDEYIQQMDVLDVDRLFEDIYQPTGIPHGNKKSKFEETIDLSFYNKKDDSVKKFNWDFASQEIDDYQNIRNHTESFLPVRTFSINKKSKKRKVSVPIDSPALQEIVMSKEKIKIPKDDIDIAEKKIEEKKATSKSQKQFDNYCVIIEPDYVRTPCIFEHRESKGTLYPPLPENSLNHLLNPDARSTMSNIASPNNPIQMIETDQICNQENKMSQIDQNMSPVFDNIEETGEYVKNISPPSELNLTVKKEKLHVSSVKKDNRALQEKILHDFQNTIGKLDNNVRICMKESINRLARNAMERQCENDNDNDNNNSDRSRGSISIGSENVILLNETKKNFQERLTESRNVETYTNPIDRIVAHLLFHNNSSTSNPEGHVSVVRQNLGRKRKTLEDGTKLHNAEM